MNCCPLTEPGKRYIVWSFSLSRMKSSFLTAAWSAISLMLEREIESNEYDANQHGSHHEYGCRGVSAASDFGACRVKQEERHPIADNQHFQAREGNFVSLVDKCLAYSIVYPCLPISGREETTRRSLVSIVMESGEILSSSSSLRIPSNHHVTTRCCSSKLQQWIG